MDILGDCKISAADGDITMGTAGHLICSCSIEHLSAPYDLHTIVTVNVSAITNLDLTRRAAFVGAIIQDILVID